MVSRPGIFAASASSEPSGPIVGPEIKLTSTPNFWRSPCTVARVFSCAPPMMSRVMMCVTRMASFGAKLRQAFADGLGFDGVGGRVGEVELIILNRLVRVVFAPRDFREAEGDLKRVGEAGLQLVVIGAGGVELVAVEIGEGAVEPGGGVVGLDFQDAGERFDGVRIVAHLDAGVAFAEEPLRIVGRLRELAFDDVKRVGIKAAHEISLRGGGKQSVVVGVMINFSFQQFNAA